MRAVYIIEPSPAQAYACRQLHNIPHYQLFLDQVETFLVPTCRRASINRSGPPIDVVTISGGENFSDDFLHVRNGLSRSSFGSINFLKLSERLNDAALENSRGHRRIDLGATGQSYSRTSDPSTLGLAKPQSHSETREPFGQEMLLSVWNAFEGLLPDVSRGMYNDPARNEMFARNYVPSGTHRLEACSLIGQILRYQGRRNAGELLKVHVDRQNDSTNPHYAWVGALVQLMGDDSTNSLQRTCQVLYGKKSVGDFMFKLHKYGDLLREIYYTWDVMSPQEKHITSAMLPPPTATHGWRMRKPHSLKTVFYSPFVGIIFLLHERFPEIRRDSMFQVALMYCCSVANCVHYFWHEAGRLLKEPCFLTCDGTPFYRMDPVEFGKCLYHHIFDVKEGKKPRSAEYVPFPRHQPTHNRRASDDQIRNSLHALLRGLHEAARLREEEVQSDTRYYFFRLAAHLAKDCAKHPVEDYDELLESGMFGIGSLGSQHMICLASALGTISPAFLGYAQIGITTETWKYLKSKFGLNDADNAEDSSTILEAVAGHLATTVAHAEEIVCKNKQRCDCTEGQFGDYLPPGAGVLTPCPAAEEGSGNGHFALLRHDGSISDPMKIELVIPSLVLSPRWYWKYTQTRGMPARRAKSTSAILKPSDLFPVEPVSAHQSSSLNHLEVPIPAPKAIVLWAPQQHEPDQFFQEDLIIRDWLNVKPNHADGLIYQRELLRVPKMGNLGEPHLFTDECGSATKKRRRNSKKVLPGTNVGISVDRPRATVVGGQWDNYYCYGVRLPGSATGTDDLVHWMRDDFGVRTDYFLTGESVAYNGRRFYRDKDMAKRNVVISLLIQRSELFKPGSRGRRSLDVPPPADKGASCSRRNKDMDQLCLPNGEQIRNDGCIESMKVQCRRKRDPCFVSVRYKKGGIAHFLCDGHGRLASAVHMVLPPPTIPRRIGGIRQDRRYVGILAHRDNRVLVKFEDGEVSWMTLGRFSSHAHWPVRYYAEVYRLQDAPFWKNLFRSGRNKELPPMFAEGRRSDWEQQYQEGMAKMLILLQKDLLTKELSALS